MREVFTEARKSNSILFFDECDALFGKRASEVKDSNDRNANMETAYLLQQVEDHDGVTIMATNLLQNIDPAFMRRIGFVVHFPFPEKEMRERLYHGMLPAAAPVADDVDFAFLAERFKVSGGGIKNIVLHAAFLAAEEDAPICMRHLVRSAVGSCVKMRSSSSGRICGNMPTLPSTERKRAAPPVQEGRLFMSYGGRSIAGGAAAARLRPSCHEIGEVRVALASQI